MLDGAFINDTNAFHEVAEREKILFIVSDIGLKNCIVEMSGQTLQLPSYLCLVSLQNRSLEVSLVVNAIIL